MLVFLRIVASSVKMIFKFLEFLIGCGEKAQILRFIEPSTNQSISVCRSFGSVLTDNTTSTRKTPLTSPYCGFWCFLKGVPYV